jgi:hypothetical protein
MSRKSLSRLAATASALAAFTLVGVLGSAHAASSAATPSTPPSRSLALTPPHLSRAQARQALSGKAPGKAVARRNGVKAHASDAPTLIVCADCGPPGISVTMCPGNYVDGTCTANGGTSMVLLGDNYVAADSIADFIYDPVITNALFQPVVGVGIHARQPRVYSRNLRSQLVAMAWVLENKATGVPTWSHWHWALTAHTDGKLVPFPVGGRCCYSAQDVTTGAGVPEFNGIGTSHAPGAFRMKLAVAWYNDNGSLARSETYVVPILTNRNAWWYWRCCNHVDGFSLS